MVFEEPDGVGDHRQVLVGRGPEHFFDVEQPGFPVNRHHRRFGLQQQPHLFVGLHGHAFATGRTERRQTGAPELPAPGLGKKLDILGVGPRPAAFNVVHPESVQSLGNAELVHDGKVHAFALAAIAQGRIVDLDFGSHKNSNRICGR